MVALREASTVSTDYTPSRGVVTLHYSATTTDGLKAFARVIVPLLLSRKYHEARWKKDHVWS